MEEAELKRNGWEPKHVCVVGAGMCGSLVACLLGNQGWKVTVVEAQSDPREHNVTETRTVGLLLSPRGQAALAHAGVVNFDRIGVPVAGRLIHAGAVDSLIPWGTENNKLLAIDRRLLNVALVEAASAYPNVTFFFNHRFEGVSQGHPTTVHARVVSGEVRSWSCELVLGCDGTFSAVRKTLAENNCVKSSLQVQEQGYRWLNISCHNLSRSVIHTWPRQGFFLHALPRVNLCPSTTPRFNCTLVMNLKGDGSSSPSFSSVQTEAEAHAFFSKYFPDVLARDDSVVRQFLSTPARSFHLTQVSAFGVVTPRVMLLGDAAHTMPPYVGQAMNLAFEDARVCAEELAKASQLDEAITAFQQRQGAEAAACQALALARGAFLLQLAGSVLVRWRMRYQAFMHKCFPRYYSASLYAMLNFSTLSYQHILSRMEAQNQWWCFGRLYE